VLRRSVELNDGFAPSQALLADVIALGPKPADAVDVGIKAIALDPQSSSARLAYARVMWALSRRDEAKAAALAGRALSRNADQRSQAEELLAFFNRAPAK
jgi:uncharacterized protein (UPF0261 family)